MSNKLTKQQGRPDGLVGPAAQPVAGVVDVDGLVAQVAHATVEALTPLLREMTLAIIDTCGKKPRKVSRLPKDQNDLAQQIFEDWKKIMGYPDREFTEARRKHIVAHIKRGRTREQFLAVIKWAANEPFYRGKNDRNTPYDDIHNLFGSVEKFDRNLLKAAGAFTKASTKSAALQASSKPIEEREF